MLRITARLENLRTVDMIKSNLNINLVLGWLDKECLTHLYHCPCWCVDVMGCYHQVNHWPTGQVTLVSPLVAASSLAHGGWQGEPHHTHQPHLWHTAHATLGLDRVLGIGINDAFTMPSPGYTIIFVSSDDISLPKHHNNRHRSIKHAINVDNIEVSHLSTTWVLHVTRGIVLVWSWPGDRGPMECDKVNGVVTATHLSPLKLI